MSGLFGSTTLEVLIGLSFIYFLLSVICSHVNELIASLLKWRAKDLESAMENLLCDPEIAEKVKNHQLIKALGSTDGETFLIRAFARLSEVWSTFLSRSPLSRLPLFEKILHQKENAAGSPSYIPSRTFALSLFHSLVHSPVPAAKELMLVPEAKELTLESVRNAVLDRIALANDLKSLLGKVSDLTPNSDAVPKPVQVEDVPQQIGNILAGLVEKGGKKSKGEQSNQQTGQQPENRVEQLRSLYEAVTAPQPGNDAAQNELDTKEYEKARSLIKAVQFTDFSVPPKSFKEAIDNVNKVINGRLDFGTVILSLIDRSKYANQAPVSVEDLRDLIVNMVALQNKLDTENVADKVREEVSKFLGTQNIKDYVDVNEVKTFDDIHKVVLGIPPKFLSSGAREAILGLINKGQADLQAALKDIEAWFDDSMDRVSGLYKRRTQIWIFFIALIVSVSIGADTFQIYKSLSKDPAKRAALVGAANSAINSGGQTPTPTGSAASKPSATSIAGSISPTATLTLTLTQQLQAELNALDSLDLPIGYSDKALVWKARSPMKSLLDPVTFVLEDAWIYIRWFFTDLLGQVLAKLPGLLVTTVAASLGAPFWFDVLNKVANLRGAGSTPPKSEPGEGDKKG